MNSHSPSGVPHSPGGMSHAPSGMSYSTGGMSHSTGGMMEETEGKSIRSIHNRTPGLQHSYGPEVAPRFYNDANAPEVVKQENIPYVLPAPYKYDQPGTTAYQQQQQQFLPGAPTSEKKRICGLTVLVFWLVIGAIVVVIAVAVGVGVAVGLKGTNSNQISTPTTVPQSSASSSSISTSTTNPSLSSTETTPTRTRTTTTSSASTPTAVTSGTTGISANSCTFSFPRTIEASDGTSFTHYCFTDWPNGVESSDGLGQVRDLSSAILYTFEDCIEECLSYNKRITSTATRCRAVTYNSNLTSIVAGQGANCFLKDKKGVDQPGRVESACAVMV